ncbi:hypothetical protein CLAFUW4_14237 [Fulvia fulva]|uniref:Uncharacterized protein n=1 Tax=Passalora fulva TaxID=5499 RepID=A0A9Q8PMQ3_PASFU|nr:uncharacterized protein CLAFUR5_14070 [Fulvia fulva]KAK4609224.1 hypothetical protein CLAFUR4_14240 [Fulvia fulva]KAK4609788.1 hypothetical protein CLAFUR0_14245 [Fulvia fulva]UJO25258.1 hypothetical protein CLAFUR5_14070 [Fulvia fulva]WPV22722.1 hypothetical protein CLAFUW4_14237 [Fulvia fulva]WPV37895.1 hypothetical protein CLAFUW7_14248 [Fulvia fulva]
MSAVTDKTKGITSDPTGTANNAVAGTDAARSDVTGSRKPGAGTDGTAPVATPEEEKSSLKIHIKLDLDVDIHLTARIKGDITIGLL